MAADLNGDRLLALRQLRGLTQLEMAADLQVSGGFLSQVTRGQKKFPEHLAVAAASTYRVPVAFFVVRDHQADLGPVTFRKTSKARASDEARVVRCYTEAARLFRHASAKSEYHAADLPAPGDFDHEPEHLAMAIRQQLGLGPTDPVANVTRLCERIGVGVVHQLDPESAENGQHAGASRPSADSDRPLVALASQLPAAVKRLTLAHELGHLIMDTDLERPLTSVRDPREKRAYRFAGALLLPASVVHARVSETLTLQAYLRIKADYGISVAAVIHRARDLGVISSARQRSLYIQSSSQGWRTDEPVPVADERPLLLGQALTRAYGNNAGARASHVTGVPADLIPLWVGQPDLPAPGEPGRAETAAPATEHHGHVLSIDAARVRRGR